MNEDELERRFRSVAEGTQPSAPQSLRHFLHELPETKPARRGIGLRLLWRSLAHGRMPRLAVGGAMAAAAVVVALVGGALLMAIRGSHTPAATPTRGVSAPTNNPTISAGGFIWTGNLETGAISPWTAVAGGSDGYLGVGRSGSTGVLLTSADAIHWSEKKTSAIDPKVIDLRSIARGPNGFVAVGSTIPPGGASSGAGSTAEPRFFYSADGSGWQETAVGQGFKGAPALVVIAGPKGFLAAGWNSPGVGDAGAGGTYLWASTDGRIWRGGWTQATVNGQAFLMWARDIYLVSGEPEATESAGQGVLPIFLSTDGTQSWSHSTGEDALARIGPAIAGVANAGDTKVRLLVWKSAADERAVEGKTELILGDGGVFTAVPADPGAPTDLRSLVVVADQSLLAASASGSLYVSRDGGIAWELIGFGPGPGPTGATLIDLGNGKYLLLGEGGIWVATPL
jgi:hypothetical protein